MFNLHGVELKLNTVYQRHDVLDEFKNINLGPKAESEMLKMASLIGSACYGDVIKVLLYDELSYIKRDDLYNAAITIYCNSEWIGKIIGRHGCNISEAVRSLKLSYPESKIRYINILPIENI